MFLACHAWGISPGEFWGMTVSEIVCLSMAKGDGQRYAGGMTAGDIEDIKSESAALRAKVKAKRNGTQAS